MSDTEYIRYSRQIVLPEVGVFGQQKLKNAKVLVVGSGGLGCPVLLYLAGVGVGKLGIVDFDTVDLSNLHRQILFHTLQVGQNKAVCAVENLQKVNPEIEYEAHSFKLSAANVSDLFVAYDIIIDGSDNFSTRYLVNDACVITNKPLIHGAIYRYEGQVSVFNYNDGPTYRCIFPEPPKKETIPNCSQAGVLGTLPGIVGTQMANEAVKLILGMGTLLSGKMLLTDNLNLHYSMISFEKNEEEISKITSNPNWLLETDYNFDCEEFDAKKTHEISVKELKNKLYSGIQLQLVDVREFYEEPKFDELKAVQMPLGEIKTKYAKIRRDIPVVVYCQHGSRSLAAINLLQEEFGYTNLLNLTGGITGYLNN